MARIIGQFGWTGGVVAAAVSLLAEAAGAQVIGQPVFGGGTAFEPEIGVVNSGAVTDVQATVSHDLKYVTLNMRAQNAQLQNLFTFNFQTAGGAQQQQFGQLPGGFVGGVNPVVGGGNGAIPALPNAPMRVGGGNGGKILLTRGITPLLGAGR
jgi:hypothetical protein